MQRANVLLAFSEVLPKQQALNLGVSLLVGMSALYSHYMNNISFSDDCGGF